MWKRGFFYCQVQEGQTRTVWHVCVLASIIHNTLRGPVAFLRYLLIQAFWWERRRSGPCSNKEMTGTHSKPELRLLLYDHIAQNKPAKNTTTHHHGVGMQISKSMTCVHLRGDCPCVSKNNTNIKKVKSGLMMFYKPSHTSKTFCSREVCKIV